MRHLLILLLIICTSRAESQPSFEAVPADLQHSYRFNLQKNFYPGDEVFAREYAGMISQLKNLNARLQKNIISIPDLSRLISEYNLAEEQYRVIDLYLFLRYVVNTTDERADRQSDSLRNIIRQTRLLMKEKINVLPGKIAKQLINVHKLSYYISSVRREGIHAVSNRNEALLKPFLYLKDPGFYNNAVNDIVFEKLKVDGKEIDVIQQISTWQSHPDEQVRRQGQITLLNGYETKKQVIGQGYITMVKGLNAFAKTKNFEGLIDEKLFSLRFSKGNIDSLFGQIIAAAKAKEKDVTAASSRQASSRYSITDATRILIKAFEVLGTGYTAELAELLNPANGRIDIVGGKNRYPIRGTASVYPVRPSVFYANNYEGYLIDLILLAHESGHAVQASLMQKNKVPMLYGAGPGYFTESFGKFNELLLLDYLSTNEKDPAMKKMYGEELTGRLEVLYGSAEEAYIEYRLIQKITDGTINKTEDLDSVTIEAGSAIFPGLYHKEPERKGLWMLLETNYYEPLHNINDMIGAVLAINYYRLFKKNKAAFVAAYVRLLSEGYYDTPTNLLRKLGVDMESGGWVREAVEMVP